VGRVQGEGEKEGEGREEGTWCQEEREAVVGGLVGAQG